jgi:hypothetical protein
MFKQLSDGKVVKEVRCSGDPRRDEGSPIMFLSGTIKNYTPGSRSKRYVGFGLGAAEVGAEIFLLDGTTKQRLKRLDLRALLAVKDRQLFLSQLAVQEDGSCVLIMWSSYGTRTSLAG